VIKQINSSKITKHYIRKYTLLIFYKGTKKALTGYSDRAFFYYEQKVFQLLKADILIYSDIRHPKLV